MSGFIGAALPEFITKRKDDRLHPDFGSMTEAGKRGGDRSEGGNEGFYSGYWPGNRGFIGDGGADISMLQGPRGRKIERFGYGVASRIGFPGVTRDQYGTPLAACTVILHRTSTRELVYDGVSDTNGNFLAQSVYAGENHYLVFHKAGAVNVFGATDNNLIGS
jgi:hypothetical protein